MHLVFSCSTLARDLQELLDISWATLKRDLAHMKDRLNAPIVFDRELGSYRFDHQRKRLSPQCELPGLWFLAEEIHALLTCSTCCPTSIPVACWARKSGHFWRACPVYWVPPIIQSKKYRSVFISRPSAHGSFTWITFKQ